MPLTQEQVHAAAADWVWIPDTAEVVENDDWTVVRFPPWLDRPLQVTRYEADPQELPVAEGVADAVAAARQFGLPELVWWVKLTSPDGVEEHVRSIGGVLDETLDVLAVDLGDGVPGLGVPAHGPDAVELRWAIDLATMRDSHHVMVGAFGGSMPPDDQVRDDAAVGVGNLERGEGGGLVAYLDGEPVGTGGVTVAGDAGRLWSGCVLASARGRGVYRALLAARLGFAHEHGAVLGLVKGRVETSGPILRRAGFAAYGQERSYLLTL